MPPALSGKGRAASLSGKGRHGFAVGRAPRSVIGLEAGPLRPGSRRPLAALKGSVLQIAYDSRRAAIGSTRVARRAGM